MIGICSRIVRRHSRDERGMTMVELLLAITILVVGLAAVLPLIATSMLGNNRNKLDTGGTLVAQMMLESISAQSGPKVWELETIKVHDCDNSVTGGTEFVVATAGGALGSAAGAPLTAAKAIDFTAATVPNYSMTYVSCGTGGERVRYDVRWNIYSINQFARLITVSARRTSGRNGLRYYVPPVTLRTIAVN